MDDVKTELEKILDGDLYNASDPTQIAMRNNARTLFSRYNQTPYNADPERQAILHQLLGKAGGNINIQAPFYCDYGTYIRIHRTLCRHSGNGSIAHRPNFANLNY